MTKSDQREKGKEQVEPQDEKLKSEAEEEAAETSESEEVEIEVVAPEADPEEKLTEELAAAKDEYLRLAAEFDNYRKRQARNLESMIKGATEGLILNLLEVLDNFERALATASDTKDVEKYHKGMKLIYDQLIDALKREGLSRFESLGETFDPNLHDAMLTVESDEDEPDTIVQEIAPGYKLNDKVIRHARVGVAARKEKKKKD